MSEERRFMADIQTGEERRLAARDARRAAQRAAALQPIPIEQSRNSKSWISVAIGAGGTAVYLTLAAWSYSAASVDDMIGAGILLVLAFLAAIAALMASERYGGFANRRRLIGNLAFAGVMAAVSVGLFWWEYSHRTAPFPTADDLSKKILEGLGLQSKPPEIPRQPPKRDLAAVPSKSPCPISGYMPRWALTERG
jgi:hypothetical protein